MSEDSSATQLEQLMALAASLLANRSDLSGPQPLLFPGTIPDDIPLEIPVPPHTRLLGTMADNYRYGNYRSRPFVVMLESDLPLEEAVSWYRTQTAALGWKERVSPDQRASGGFVQSDYHRSARLAFCHTPSCAWLSPTLAERETGTTLVRLDLMLEKEGNPCTQPEQPGPHGSRGHHGLLHPPGPQLPTLIAPAGAQLQGGGSHLGPKEIQVTSQVTTPLDLDAVAQHYAGQLIQASWTQTEAGAGGPFVWSTWQFTNSGSEPEPWNALFFVLKLPNEPVRYSLDLRAWQSKIETTQ